MTTFEVRGIPRPKGSKRAFVVQSGGRPRAILAEQGGENLVEWLERVRSAARAVQPEAPLHGAVAVSIVFRMPRPQAHLRSNGQLKPAAPSLHTKAPDIDKLARAVLDALQGVLFADDAQVALIQASKVYCDPGASQGASVTVLALLPPQA